MINLHKYYYKDYFSLKDVPIDNIKRHLDYELLLDDTKKNQLEKELGGLEKQKRNAQGNQKEQIEAQITEIKAQLAVNVNVLKHRNNHLTGSNYSKKDELGNPTRDLIEEALIINEASPNNLENRFSLEISYPGLVTGVGTTHEAKIEGEFKLGVHFDWTYGMPVIYGSSVKGVLRAWFCEFYEGNLDPIDLMMDIFEGACERDIDAEKKEHGEKWEEKVKKPENRIYKKRKSIYERDIFFDAVLVKPDKKGRILCSDSITPHLQGPLKNPIPITFLKIAPGCTVEFRFKFVKSIVNGKFFDEQEKKLLFQKILTTVGIGAKTNVGYGQLKVTEEKK